MKRVTRLDGRYSFGEKVFGPFEATPERPYLEVPGELAAALGLPLHESEVQAEPNPEEGASVEQLLQANADLKGDLDALHSALGWTEGSTVSAVEMVRNLRGAAETNRQEVARLSERNRKLEKALKASTIQPSGVPDSHEGGTPAPVADAPAPQEPRKGKGQK